MFAARLMRIAWAAAGLLLVAARRRLPGPARGPTVPEALRDRLERLGPTFVKFGQALGLRRDLLPDEYVAELQKLQDRVAPFPAEVAAREIELSLGRRLDELFAEFEREPMAAASIAQVHKARLADGRAVIVKVRRPGIKRQIDRDMRTLLRAARLAEALLPWLRRYQPVRIIEEVWTNLRRETDFRQEARNIRRFAEAFKDWPTVHIPGTVDDLFTEWVLVQELSGGRRIDDPAVRADGPRLAQAFVDAYLHQFFVLGIFHGDPHPGNLFIMPDGRICFHDFGLVGHLDRAARRNLALFLEAFVHQDADWLLDACLDLGILGGEMDRGEFRRGIEEIIADYAALPLKEWSLAEAFLRVTRLGRGGNVMIPHNLLVFMRAMFLAENAVRTLDPEFKLLDSLLAKGESTMKAVLREGPSAGAMDRLKDQAILAMQDLPAVLGSWIHKMQIRGEGLEISLRHQGLEKFEERMDRGANRVSMALVTLGLYIAASLLMQHSVGPRLFGEMPLLAALGYLLALWFTFRLARGIARSGRL